MFAAELVRQQRPEIWAVFAGDLRQDRWQFDLWVDCPALIGFPIEVDRKAWNHRNGQLEIDELAFNSTVAAIGHASSQGQVAVEPRSKQRTAVHFYAKLPETLALQFGLRLDAQAGTVGVRTDQAHALFDDRVATQLKSDDRGVVTGDVVATARFSVPSLAFIQGFVASGLQGLGKAGSGMKWGRGGLEVIDQTLVEFFAHGWLRTAMARSLSRNQVQATGRTAYSRSF